VAVKPILLLGNPELYEVSVPVKEEELHTLEPIVQNLHDTLFNFREKHGYGRAIAAPQISIKKRLIYMHVDKPVVFVNPDITRKSKEVIEVWDDCMSFPELLVKVKRYKSCSITFRNLKWEEHTLFLKDDLSELLQHECDHLDGILAVSRAIDERSFALKSQKHLLK